MEAPDPADEPPASLPNYLADGIPKQDTATLRSIQQWIDEIIEFRNQPITADDLPDDKEPVEDPEDSGKGVVVKEYVKCGDDTCKCKDGNKKDMHGPYRYRYFRVDGKLTSEYVGKA